MELKPFSETISTGLDIHSEEIVNQDVFEKPPAATAIKRPDSVERAIEYLRKVYAGKEAPEKVLKARQVVQEWLKTVWKKGFLERVKDPAVRETESKYLNLVLNSSKSLPSPQAAAQTVVKVEKVLGEVVSPGQKAENILKAVAGESKSLQKYLTKATMKKLLPKIIPLLGAGLVVATLINKVRELIGEDQPEEFLETRMQHGENYHPDRGWY